MKFNIKSAILGCVVGVMVSSSVSVLAYNGTKNISATFKNIKIYVDGSELTPRDSKGNVLEPFIYNGSTYLPVRAVGEAVGKNVSYDANTNSVYLGDSNSMSSSPSKGSSLEPYQTKDMDINDIQMGGNNYRDALKSGYSSTQNYAYYNLGGKYTTVSGIYGNIDNTGGYDTDAVVRFYGDGILLGEYKIEYGNLPKSFALNITGVSQFSVEIDKNIYIDVGIGDIYFK